MEAIVDLASLAGAIIGSLALGAAKKYTGILDGKVGNVVKPVQPLIVGGMALLLPVVANAIGVAPPPADAFVSAPTATVLAITMREIYARASRKAQK